MSYSDQQVPDTVGSADAPRSQAQFFVPAPEDLPPPETVFGPTPRRTAGAIPDPADRRDVQAPPEPTVHGGADDLGGDPFAGGDPYPGGESYASDPHPGGDSYAGDRYPGGDSYAGGVPSGIAGAAAGTGVPDAPLLDPQASASAAMAGLPDAPVLARRSAARIVVPAPEPEAPVAPMPDGIPDAPVLDPRSRARDQARTGPRRKRAAIDRSRVAVVYEIDGPRVRLGVAWFLGAMALTIGPSPALSALLFAVTAGLAARQLVQAWGAVSWQADVAAGLGSVPVLAALVGGAKGLVGACVLGVVVAVGCALAPDGARMPGGSGRAAAASILCFSLVPAVGAASFVLVRAHSATAAVVLLVVASAYEVGDFIVGSGGSTPIEGPLAGITTATLLALPLALVLVEPYDTGGVALLGFTALACPLGQLMASAVLPGAGAPAPALRRIDTLLLLAPLWAATAGAF